MGLKDFACLIISHGRPKLNMTENLLRDCGYTGRIIYVVDDMDKTLDEYYEEHGFDDVFCYNKRYYCHKCDRMDNFTNMNATLFSRNIAWDVARELHLESFLVLDDDYYYFGHRGEHGAKKTNRLDEIFEIFIDLLKTTPIKCVAFSQCGDHIGGWDGKQITKRKIMNSFFCLTSRPFKFYGMMNDDVNCYLRNGSIGDLFFTYMNFQLDQTDTQKNDGGLTTSYKLSGTYVKSFYSVMIAPSSVKIRLMGTSSSRIHHSIQWDNTCPCIINEQYKKK